MNSSLDTSAQIAIIGMAGRFPGARNLDEFWRNLDGGVESISFFSDEELAAEGIPAAVLAQPNYVKARAVLEDADLFDADFFGFSPREAETTDPQQRVFLECAWHALETAGYRTDLFRGSIGVFAGASFSAYFLQLCATPSLVDTVGFYRLLLGNDKDYVPTWVSYKLNLTGPSINVQSACSTSLVAVHVACRSLLHFECDMALAGGVSIGSPRKSGYIYQEGGISSPDGHCRSFDTSARGSVPGEGVGVVVLKRLEDALRDRDSIHAIIRSSAVNNDGAGRVSFTSPGVDTQAELMTTALLTAGVDPAQIGYLEAHGSGTPLGDRIELAALAQAYRGVVQKSIALGSVKTNIGHAGAAAGVAGLIKAVLSVKHRRIPPSLHFKEAGPGNELACTPFYINTRSAPWPETNTPAIAAVNSVGMGGTNAHVILEQAPIPAASQPAKLWQLLLLSARTQEQLEESTDQLVDYLRAHDGQNLGDVAHTLQVGRKSFSYRRALVCRDSDDAMACLEQRSPTRLLSGFPRRQTPTVSFLLSGLGDHYPGMGRGLYETEPEFRKQVDLCCDLLRPLLGQDLRTVLYPEANPNTPCANSPQMDLRALLSGRQSTGAPTAIDQISFTHPAMFTTGYALSRMLISWGIRPDALAGYSLGEYIAACLAGVLSLEDALKLTVIRTKLIQELAPGRMLAVMSREPDIAPLLTPPLYVAGIAGASLTIAAGPVEAVEQLRSELSGRRILCRQLNVTHAFHTPLMEPVADRLTQAASGIRREPPRIPYISNVTGSWITAADAVDPAYWARHLCRPVRFFDGLKLLTGNGRSVALEIGPGQMLGSLAVSADAEDDDSGITCVASMRSSLDPRTDREVILGALGELWLNDVNIDWVAFWGEEGRRRIPLPTYPFQRRRYWAGDAVMFAAREAAQPETLLQSAGQPVRATAAGRSRRSQLPSPYVAPTSPMEGTMVALWQNLLGIDDIGIHDNFFQLGGNSLLGVQLALQIQKTFQVDLRVAAIFTSPTVAQLSMRIEEILLDEIERMDGAEDSSPVATAAS